jgi:putative DNA primase/helicase
MTPDPHFGLDKAVTAAEDNGTTEVGAEHLSDLGNARRLARLHGADLHWTRAMGWLTWDGARWRQDETQEVQRRAKQAVLTLFEEARQSRDDLALQRKLAGHAIKSQAAAQIHAMVTLAASEPGIALLVDQLDCDAWTLNVLNGTVDLKTGQLRPHRREDLLSKLAPVVFDDAATCPEWLTFLDQIFQRDPALITYVQKLIGHAIVGTASEQLLALCYGTGRNGKTTFLETIGAILGDYAQHTPAETFLTHHYAQHPTDRAALRGARFVWAIEAARGRTLNEALVKEMTGQDSMTARFMRHDSFTFLPVFTPFLATNAKPRIKGRDLGIWSRVKLIPFTYTFAPTHERKDFREAVLVPEHAGILQWAIAGCLRWQAEGLRPEPPAVRLATDAYRREQDDLGPFFDDLCVITPTARVPKTDLYAQYRAWCDSNGDKKVATKIEFGRLLDERGFTDTRTSGTRLWVGLRLRTAADPPPSDTTSAERHSEDCDCMACVPASTTVEWNMSDADE